MRTEIGIFVDYKKDNIYYYYISNRGKKYHIIRFFYVKFDKEYNTIYKLDNNNKNILLSTNKNNKTNKDGNNINVETNLVLISNSE